MLNSHLRPGRIIDMIRDYRRPTLVARMKFLVLISRCEAYTSFRKLYIGDIHTVKYFSEQNSSAFLYKFSPNYAFKERLCYWDTPINLFVDYMDYMYTRL